MSAPFLSIIVVSPQAARLLAGLQAVPERLATNLRQGMDRANDLTVGAIQRDRLSQRGPETLGVRTNRLRGSIRRSAAIFEGAAGGVTGEIGSNVRYLGVHEFGYMGEVKVKAHRRKVQSRDERIGKRGKPIKSGKLTASGVSFVKSYTRKMDVTERAPLRRGIEASRGIYEGEFTAAFDRSMPDGEATV